MIRSDMAAPDISIIVVSWNVCEMLRDCLQSIVGQTKKGYEIIVVDNASVDGSAEMVAEEFPEVRLIANDQNIGFAAANNQGLEISSGHYVLLLNPDTLILDGAIDRMIDWMNGHPDVGCAGCQVFETETVIQRTCFSDPGPRKILFVETGLHRIFAQSRFFGFPEYGWWDRQSEMDVDVVSGMFMLVPRHVLDEVGMMDEAFFVYSEEADWCRRIRQAGYRCVFTPAARIMHRDGGGKSTSQIKPRMYVQLQKSAMIYVRKHYGPIGLITAKTIYSGMMLARGILFGVTALITRGSEARALAKLGWVSARFHLFGIEPKP